MDKLNNFEIELYNDLCKMNGLSTDEEISSLLRNAVVTGEMFFSGKKLYQQYRIVSQILEKSSKIYSVDFSDCVLSPDGLETILRSISRNKILKELNLYGNNIKGENVVNLGKMLASNTSLTTLILKWNNIGLDANLFCLFCKELQKNTTLTSLDLRNNQLDSECISYLADALKQNHHLINLDLRWNKILNSGAEYLLQALEENKSIENMQMKGNFIHSEVMLVIEQTVKNNMMMKRVSLESEKKLEHLKETIKAISQTHDEHLEIIKESAEKRFLSSDRKLLQLTNKMSTNDELINELEEKILVLTTNLNLEKQRSESLEEALNEKVKTYEELLESHRSSNEMLKKTLHEKDVEMLRMNLDDAERASIDKDQVESLKISIETEKIKNKNLTDEINRINSHIELVVKQKTEILEVERDMWHQKYNELESSSNAQLQRMKSLAIDKQQSLENTIMELSDKQASQILTLSERYDRMCQEKSMIEEQLTSAQKSVITLQRENTSLISQIAEPVRRVTNLLEELSSEKNKVEKLKHQNTADTFLIKNLQIELERLQTNYKVNNLKNMELISTFDDEIKMLKDKKKELEKKLERKEKQISELKNKQKKKVELLQSTVNKYLEQSLSPISSEEG